MLTKLQILFFILVLSFVSCLVNNSFADFEEKIEDAGEINGAAPIIDDVIIEGEPEFPTREGPEWTQELGDLRWVPNFIFGPAQFEKMRDLPRNSQDYQLGTKVAYFSVQGLWICTGFLVGPDLLMTNAHCIPSDLSKIRVYMEYYQERSVDPTLGGVHAGVKEVLRYSVKLDYALLRLDTSIGNTYGWLTLDDTFNPQPGQSVKLIHHSDGRSKEISRQDSEIVIFDNAPPSLLAYYADTEGGTSGAPVFIREETGVIAINFGGLYRDINDNDEYDPGIDEPICNVGNLMSYIVPEIEQWLPDGPPTIPPPTPSDHQMYWTDAGTDKIQRANLDGTNIQDIVTGLNTPWGIAVDVQGGKIYWADAGTDKIQRANLDGTNIQDLVTTGLDSPWGIALDVQDGKIYWTDLGTDKIQRANLDGTNIQDIVTTGLDSPDGIALDIAGRKIYWTDFGTDKIQRANFDGTNIQDIVTTGLDSPWGIALDMQGGKMYWTDAGTDKIQRANLDGTNVQELITTGLNDPEDIILDVQGGKMYWTDWGTDKIQRANLDGTNIQDLVTTGLDNPVGIALSTSTPAGGSLTFNPSTIPNQTFRVGTPAFLILPIAIGGTAPYTYTVTPTLPAGLQFDAATRILNGTPTTATPQNTYTYTATDTASASGTLTFTIMVIEGGSGNLDVNGDGQVTVLDLAIVALFYGTQVPQGVSLPADVNADGVVNLLDLTAVAQAIDAQGFSAATVLSLQEVQEAFLAAAEQAAEMEAVAEAPIGFGTPQNALSSSIAYRNVAAALADARHLTETGTTRLGKELTVLKELLTLIAEMVAIPEKTALLPNYPNPFNPETWIPYHLATEADVTVTIYNVQGSTVRTLVLGHQPAGVYESQGRAAYWDGRNQLGEHVASGVYFYTLSTESTRDSVTAGDFTATRKLLITK